MKRQAYLFFSFNKVTSLHLYVASPRSPLCKDCGFQREQKLHMKRADSCSDVYIDSSSQLRISLTVDCLYPLLFFM